MIVLLYRWSRSPPHTQGFADFFSDTAVQKRPTRENWVFIWSRPSRPSSSEMFCVSDLRVHQHAPKPHTHTHPPIFHNIFGSVFFILNISLIFLSFFPHLLFYYFNRPLCIARLGNIMWPKSGPVSAIENIRNVSPSSLTRLVGTLAKANRSLVLLE